MFECAIRCIFPPGNFQRSMANIVLLLFCFVAGIGLRLTGRMPENASSVLNGFIINIGLPAMALAYLNGIQISSDLGFAILVPWVLFFFGMLILWPLCRALKFSRPTTGCVILVGSMANTAFLGIPLIEAYYGSEWMSVGIVMDQLGSYLVLAFCGITVARLFAAGPRPDPGEIVGTILRFPPFLATVLALILIAVPYPAWLSELLERLAVTVAPLALVSVGFQLRVSEVRGKIAPLIVGLGYKLVLGPLLLFGLFVGLLGSKGTIAQLMIFEAAMAPMIGASIVAMDNDLDPSLATLLVGLGVPLSFLTLALWYQVLGGV